MNSNNIQELSTHSRYQYFIEVVTTSNELWTLIDTDNTFALFEVDNKTVFSLWPEEYFIESNLSVDWKEYIPFKLDIDTLEETVIPNIRENGYYINVFPVNSKTGYIVSLNDFVADLNSSIESS